MILISQILFSQTLREKDFRSYFEKYGVNGCFVLYNASQNEIVRYNVQLCDSAYIPASTFKIPNSLIVLEEEIISDTNEIIKWDGKNWPVVTWNQDQTLKTAMKYSCVWVYVQFAEKIGIDKYYGYINSFGYGNKDLSGPPSRFWLQGALRISANEQVEFLRNFYNYQLPVSHRSVDIVKEIMLLEHTGSCRLYGKTGGGMLNETDYIMWLIGFVEKNNVPYFFAMNFITSDYGKLSQARYDITKSILRELNLMD